VVRVVSAGLRYELIFRRFWPDALDVSPRDRAEEVVLVAEYLRKPATCQGITTEVRELQVLAEDGGRGVDVQIRDVVGEDRDSWRAVPPDTCAAASRLAAEVLDQLADEVPVPAAGRDLERPCRSA